MGRRVLRLFAGIGQREQMSARERDIMQRHLVDAGFRELRFAAGPVKLNYVVGPRNGPALVLIPAQIGSWESYGRVLLPLSRQFQIFVVDLRGHGGTTWTTGDYTWASVGGDLAEFVACAVARPAILSGNSSGGLVALWVAANRPELVAALVLEDAPVFSAEMPRFRDEDRFVYEGLQHLVTAIGDPRRRDLADYFRGQVLPVDHGRRVRRVPEWFCALLSWMIRRYEAKHPGEPIDIPYLPSTLRVLLKPLSTFDPDFARAFVDGRVYAGLDHVEALRRVGCPLLVMHADWFRHPAYGLVGARDDRDAARIQGLVPQARYVSIHANHVIHTFAPARFVEEVTRFASTEGLL
jgi:pimeloyl-ACP methyl ester carboxylesterase